MKKIYCIFLILAAFWSCRDNADFPFQGEDAVYFQLNTTGYTWTKTLDSLVYSFAGKGVDEDTLWIRVNLEGTATPQARPLNIVIDEANTTAQAGLHYEALKADYELPGDSVYTKIPVIIYNKDKQLENKQVVIALALQPTESLALGITDRTKCRLLVSNMLNKPTYWESTIFYDFGVYSRKKHELCMLELGMDFPIQGSEYTNQGTMWDIYGAYMSDYFEENYPVKDENGAIIEPW